MKNLLIVFSSLTILTLTGNGINNSIINSSAKLKTESANGLTKTSLFNYQYGLLNADPNKPSENTWITNQSSKDHKIYSYNLNYVIGDILSDGTKAETVFMVDEDGNLDYNCEILAIDQPTLDDSRTEMIDHRKVTTIKENYTPYSNSKYVDAGYFTDQVGVNTWQYLQQGQAEPNIDISHEENTSNIEHRKNESEALGLYYIAKQSRAKTNRIDLAVADEIAKAFISKSSLNTDLNNKENLIDQIVTLINKNDNVFNFFLNKPFDIGREYENYSMNYIFDSSNHLIEIYHHRWNNNNNYNQTLNYHYSMWYNGYNSGDEFYSPTFIIFNFWNSYAANWNDFTSIYPIISFDNNSSLSVLCYLYGADKKVGAQLTIDTSHITLIVDNYAFESHLHHDGGFWGADVSLNAYVYIWHDDHNVYLIFRALEGSDRCLEGSNIAVNLNTCTFHNVLN